MAAGLWASAVASLAAFLVGLDTPLEDPAKEARARQLMREIRCVACENEPISESAAPIAEDMRDRVRSLIGQGASDDEVRDWFVERYDTYVLFRPPNRGLGGVLLWGTPFALILLVGGMIVVGRWRHGGAIAPVTPESYDHTNETET